MQPFNAECEVVGFNQLDVFRFAAHSRHPNCSATAHKNAALTASESSALLTMYVFIYEPRPLGKDG